MVIIGVHKLEGGEEKKTRHRLHFFSPRHYANFLSVSKLNLENKSHFHVLLLILEYIWLPSRTAGGRISDGRLVCLPRVMLFPGWR